MCNGPQHNSNTNGFASLPTCNYQGKKLIQLSVQKRSGLHGPSGSLHGVTWCKPAPHGVLPVAVMRVWHSGWWASQPECQHPHHRASQPECQHPHHSNTTVQANLLWYFWLYITLKGCYKILMGLGILLQHVMQHNVQELPMNINEISQNTGEVVCNLSFESPKHCQQGHLTQDISQRD